MRDETRRDETRLASSVQTRNKMPDSPNTRICRIRVTQFLGVFIKLQQAPIRSLSASTNSAPTGWSFMKFDT